MEETQNIHLNCGQKSEVGGFYVRQNQQYFHEILVVVPYPAAQMTLLLNRHFWMNSHQQKII